MNVPKRFAARLISPPLTPKVRHYEGMPHALSGGSDTRREMPPTSVLLIEQSDEGVLLIRYANNGRFAGDTWHPTFDEAREQAVYEFGDTISAWKEVPVDVNDIVAFMTKL